MYLKIPFYLTVIFIILLLIIYYLIYNQSRTHNKLIKCNIQLKHTNLLKKQHLKRVKYINNLIETYSGGINYKNVIGIWVENDTKGNVSLDGLDPKVQYAAVMTCAAQADLSTVTKGIGFVPNTVAGHQVKFLLNIGGVNSFYKMIG